MKISGVTINNERIHKIKESNNPLNARTIWEKIKNWFSIGREDVILPLIKDVFFDSNKSVLDKINGFFKLRDFSGNAHEDNFVIEVKNKEIYFSMLLNKGIEDEKISFLFCLDKDNNVNQNSDANKLIKNFIDSLEKYQMGDLIFSAMHKFYEKNKTDNEINKIIKNIIIELVNENIDKFHARNNIEEKNILQNQIKKSVTLDCEDYIKTFKNTILNDKQSLDDIKKELLNDISRMTLILDNKKIELNKIALDEIDKFFIDFNDEEKKLIYSLLYQKGVLMLKDYLIQNDLFAGMVNTPYLGKTSIEVIKNKDNINIKVKNKKLLQNEEGKNNRKNIDSLMNSGLYYINEQHYNLVNLIIDTLVKKPLSILNYLNVINDFAEVKNSLSIGTMISLENDIELIFIFDLKKKELTLDKKSKYEYKLVTY